MPDDFQYDVFLSYSSKDKLIVGDIAERLKKDGIKVWFDKWVLKTGDSIPAKIEEGQENSIVLVCPAVALSRTRKSGMFRFRDPRNKESRSLPLQLVDAREIGGATPVRTSMKDR